MSSITTIIVQFFKKVFSKATIIVAIFAYFFLASGSAFAASQRYDSNGNFTVPVGVVQVSVSMSGGGGGGGSISNNGAGQNGRTTSFGTLLTAAGGFGGKNGSADIGGGIGGAAGGVGGSAGATGTNIGYGGMGGNSLFGTGGAGNSNLYYHASDGIGNGAGGGGGFDGGGGGGAQAFDNTVVSVTPGQVIAVVIGAGGAGSTGNSAFLAAGGDGAPGFVEITYAPDTTAPTATVAYSTTAPTNGNVVATITPSEAVTVTNNGGLFSYIFTTNGSFTFDFIDMAGNIGSVTATVANIDTTAPIITILGSNPYSVVLGDVYTDAGATAFDNIDGDITPSIVVVNPVDTGMPGVYTVSYSVSDSFGNVATQVNRTVNVILTLDTIPPSAPIIASVNTIATTTLGATLTALWSDSTDNSGSLAGYSFVWDALAGTNPDSIVEGQATTTTTTLPNGTWYFHIIAVDPVLNVSTPTTSFGPIVINNALAGDTTAPTGPTTVTSSTHTVGVSSATTTVSLSWDTATDDVALAGYSYVWDTNASSTPDNLADTAATALTTNLPNGSWYFHILSTDTSGNVSSPVVDFGPIIIATITTDVISPAGPTAVTSSSHTISVSSLNQSVIVSWDTATDETMLAGYSYIWDNSASTIPDAIPETVTTTTTTILPNGSWYFHVQSTDTAGNVSIPVIHFGPVVINTNLPADLIPPTAPIATVATSSATMINASWTDSTDNSGSFAGYSFVWDTNASTNPDAITETQNTSTSVTVPDGLWYFHLVAVDPSLNISTPTTHTGPVKIDTTAPTLTLVGAALVPVVMGNSYTDAGATALDNIDGNITASIIATSTVNTAVLGTYTVTYNVSDSSGNSATSLVRTVFVIAAPDTTPPVITVTGANLATVTLGNSYADLGATATDNVDGNITASIVTTNLVNTAVVGAYSVDYSVSDSSGNIATSSRAVIVVGPIPFTVFASVIGNGTITPNATTTVLQGNSQSYTITPNFGYDFTSLLVDGVSVATTTSYTFTNIQADHTLSAVFMQSAGAPYFTIFASAGANGTVSPMGTTTIQQGNDQSYTITPNAGYSVDTLTVDGVATTTSTSFAFSNINADHTIDASFIDPVVPVGPTAVTSSSHTTFVISVNQTVNTAWDTATDNVALAGYSYAWDMNPATSPDAVVDTVTANATTVLPYGTWYFHVVSVDTSGNVSSSTIHFGPVILSDSQVLITNSTIGGTTYTLYSPTVASSTALGVTGSSTITNSTITAPWNITDAVLDGATLTNATVAQANAVNSTIINANLTGCAIVNSFVKNYFAVNCNVTDSIVDPVGGLNDLTGSTVSGNSQIYYSDVIYSTVQSSYIATSTIGYSTFINATSTYSTIATSTITGGTVELSSLTNATSTNSAIASSTITFADVSGSTVATSTVTSSTVSVSTLSGSTVSGGSNVASSTLSNAVVTSSTLNGTVVLGTGSTITNSTLASTTVTDAAILDGIMTSGTIVNPSGTTVTVSTSTPLTVLINYSPVASFTTSANYLAVTMTDTSTDPNSASLPDSWTYLWNFGDGVTASANTATVGNNQTHTYSTAGTYTISLTLTDQYGLSSTATTAITVSASVPVVVPSTSGGGGGGVISGLITGNPLIIGTYGSIAQKATPSAPIAPVAEIPAAIPVVTPVATPAKTPSPAVVQLVPEQAAVTEEVVPTVVPVEVAATSTPISNQLAAVAEFVTTNSTALAVVGFITTILALGYFIRRRIALKKLASISFTPTEIEAEAITEEAEKVEPTGKAEIVEIDDEVLVK